MLDANKMSRENFIYRHCQSLLGAGFLLLFFHSPVLANPTGGTVTQGSATFSSSGSTFNINQTSANAFINWNSFNIGAGETVNFNQPGASSVTFNQINDVNPSQILGNLNANGYVVLENANGFYIGGQAVLNAHGLVMTTATTPAVNLSDGGPWSFDAPPPAAKIQNYGQINITGGGTAYLIAADIVNGGTITAPNGHIGLYDGETVLVSMSPNGQGLNAEVTLPQGSVDNEGNLTADGGSVVAQAQFVNQNGIIQANTAENVNGTIELLGSSSVALGANSVISAQGSAQGVSSGGTVTIKAGNTFSDQPGSTICVAGGAQGGNGGQVEISAPQMGAINSVVDGQAQDGFTGGTLTIDPADIWLASVDTDPSAPAGYSIVNINDYSGLSQINLQADDNIVLNTVWQLLGQTTPSTLSLTAGNDITLEPGSGISAGQDWNVNLTAGTGFVPTTGQPTPASGSDGIYLYGYSAQDYSYIKTANGNITLSAANEVQVGWSGSSAGPGAVNTGVSSITTVDGGNISVTTQYGDVNTGSDPAGFDYHATAPYYTVDGNLGGISTAAGGNVTISAGGNVISYTPLDGEDGGTGAFGSQPGNVTITAGGNVYGHYVVANGVGTVFAGQNVGAAAGDPFALSLISGGWSVNAPNGDIYLQEVRNPNGDFNNATGSRRGQSATGQFLFNYSPQAYVDLMADSVYLTGQNVPRLSGFDVPVLYPPILDITAGAGGVTLEGNVTLYPSVDQNLNITTTDGGNLTAVANPNGGSPYELLMSDSSADQWKNGQITFTAADHGGLANEPNDSTPVEIDISGSMENLELITTKVTDILVGGDMINCGFSGQNLQASDVTSITVGGQIYNTSPYSFINLSQAIPTIPAQDLLQGEANSWNDIFTLAVNPSLLSSELAALQRDNTPLSEWANAILTSTSLFGEQSIGGQLVGQNPGFVYNTTTGRLGFTGTMSQSLLTELTQPITILHLVNGQPVINPTTGQIETDTISWAGASALNTLYTASQGNPSLSESQLGYRIGGPGEFNIEASSISLGNSDGIISGGIYDPNGLNRYSDLASVTPVGASIDVTVTGPDTAQGAALTMLTSTIASLDGGNVNVVATDGSMDLGSSELLNSTGQSGVGTGTHSAFGIYTTGGGNVTVTALGDVDIDGSRIATYDGGNIVVESLTGSVNIGNGTPDLNSINVVYTSEPPNSPYNEDVFGSGILAETLVPPQLGAPYPPDAAKAPGNITVESPQGDIVASTAGIIQEALDGNVTPGPTVTLIAGTFPSGNSPGYAGNIDLGNSGVIGGAVTLSANGSISGQIISRQNSTVNAAQSFSGTLLAGGSADVTGGGTVSGTIIGASGVNVSAGNGVTASLLGQNVSVNGGASQDTLGSSAGATSATQSAAQQASSQSQQQVAADTTQGDDKKKKNTQIRKIGRVTVILASAK